MKFVRPSHGQTLQLTYFQNNILHLFALPALIATILIRNGHISRADVNAHTRSLFYFLKHELFAPVQESKLDDLITSYINVFVQGGYILELDHGMLTLSGDGYEEMLILSSSIRLNLVRYLVAVTVLKQLNAGDLNKQEFIDACVQLCHLVPSEVTNNSPEFADPIMFNIMCDTFIRHHYFSYLEDGTISPNPPKIEKLAVAATPLLAAKLVRHLKQEITSIKLKTKAKPEEPKTEEAQAEAPAESKTEEPKSEAPAESKAEEPKAEAPAESKAEEPKSDEPKTETPAEAPAESKPEESKAAAAAETKA